MADTTPSAYRDAATDSSDLHAPASPSYPEIIVESARSMADLMGLYHYHERERHALSVLMDQTSNSSDFAVYSSRYRDYGYMKRAVAVCIVDLLQESPLSSEGSAHGHLHTTHAASTQQEHRESSSFLTHQSAVQVIDSRPSGPEILPHMSRVMADEELLARTDSSCPICKDEYAQVADEMRVERSLIHC
ncbi:hypothetical protein N7492_008086 [Penicillium capsulatum]|uniref:Uncharacterized protein n=1 Tax=Penicillium capsulatum TaxID=69766 RepID=A0A9W9HRH0_9EURO|nr:hypothetical protein N7492_008086 [Penicillium capsulatum]